MGVVVFNFLFTFNEIKSSRFKIQNKSSKVKMFKGSIKANTHSIHSERVYA